MIECPKCSRLAEPHERYCSRCHTVFPSDTREAASLRLASGTSTGWRVPSLVLIFVLGAVFVLIDADASAEAGSFSAAASATKRAVLEWVAEYTGFMPT